MKEVKLLPYGPSEINTKVLAGIDEVGRGPLAGPVVAAAVILPKDFTSPLLRDSKKLTEKQRNEAYKVIIDNAVSYSVQASSVKYINANGINKAIYNAIYKCIDDLSTKPEHLLIDGNQWTPYGNLPFECVVKGDDTYSSIAAASILAKVRRDEYMVKLSELFPEYNFNGNKGYCCAKHGRALIDLGATVYHRTQYVNTWFKNNKNKYS